MYERLAPSHAACPARPTPIDEDAEQPRTESLWIFAARERSVRTGERILQRLLRIFPIAQHVHGIPRVLVPVSRDERAVRVHLSVQHSIDECCIRALHTVWTLHRHLSSQSRTRIPREYVTRSIEAWPPSHVRVALERVAVRRIEPPLRSRMVHQHRR